MLNRFALRILKLKASRSNDKQGVDAINKLMRDRELMQLFNDYLGAEFYGSPLDLIDWLAENWKDVLEAILKLIDMFSEE